MPLQEIYNNYLYILYLVCPIITSTDEIYISPFIYDVQNNIHTVIRIKGLASTVDVIKATTCDVMDLDSRIIMVILVQLLCVQKYFM